MIDSFSPRRCDRARAQISALLDGELSELEETDLRLHLEGCESCVEYQAGALTVSSSLRAAPLEELDFPIDVPSRRRVATRWIQAGSAAAAVLVAIGLGSSQGILASHGGLGSASSSTSPVRASASKTYLQSPDYERHLLKSLRASYRGPTPHHGRTGVAIAL